MASQGEGKLLGLVKRWHHQHARDSQCHCEKCNDAIEWHPSFICFVHKAGFQAYNSCCYRFWMLRNWGWPWFLKHLWTSFQNWDLGGLNFSCFQADVGNWGWSSWFFWQLEIFLGLGHCHIQIVGNTVKLFFCSVKCWKSQTEKLCPYLYTCTISSECWIISIVWWITIVFI